MARADRAFFGAGRAAVLIVAVVGLLPAGGRAQIGAGPVKGFVISDADRETGRRKSLLSGESARNLSNDVWLVVGSRLEIYGDDGQTNLIVTSPQCRYDDRSKVAVSPGELRVTTGDGRFSIEGVGYEWRQADLLLSISNRVHAVIRKDVIVPAGNTNRSPATNAPGPPVHIYSDRFLYQTNRALFRENVRLDDPEGRLTCGLLDIRFAQTNRQLEYVFAENNVVIESGELRAAGERARYHLLTDVVELSGNPSWRIGAREGQAEEVVLNRKTREFHARRAVRMKLPGGAFDELTTLQMPAGSRTNRTTTPEQPVYAEADEFHLRPDPAATNTSVAVFSGNVRVIAERGALRCERLTVRSSGPSGQADHVFAEQNVVIEQGEDRVTGREAVFVGAETNVTVTGNPAWRVGSREGTAERLVFDLARGTYRATGGVKMRLPPGSFGQTAWLLPRSRTGESPSTNASPSSVPPGQPIETVSEEFELRSPSAADAMTWAIFRGHVQVADPGRMTLTCETLSAATPAGTNQVQCVIAERNVQLVILEPRSKKRASGERLVYSAERQEVELTGEREVEMEFEDEAGVTLARGTKLLYHADTDVLELLGQATATGPYGQAAGERVVLDRLSKTVKATGGWKMKLRPEVFENRAKPSPGGQDRSQR